MKRILLINSILWTIAAIYFFYSVVVGVLTLDWHRAAVGFLVIAFFTCTEVIFGFISN